VQPLRGQGNVKTKPPDIEKETEATPQSHEIQPTTDTPVNKRGATAAARAEGLQAYKPYLSPPLRCNFAAIVYTS